MQIKDGGSQKYTTRHDPHGFSMRITASVGYYQNTTQKRGPERSILPVLFYCHAQLHYLNSENTLIGARRQTLKREVCLLNHTNSSIADTIAIL